MPRLLLPAILLGILGVGAAANAQSAGDLARARALDKAGTEAFRAGRYDQAIASYQAAYALAPRPGGLFNIGRAYHKKGDTKHALEFYKRYLADEPKGPVADEARGYVAALERSLPAAEATPAAPPAPPPESPAKPPESAPPTPPPLAETAAVVPPARAPVDTVTAAATPATAPSPWSFGPEVGLTISGFDTEATTSDYQTGFTAGAFVRYAALPSLAVRAELLFVQKGDNDGMDPERIEYLELPLLLEASTYGVFVAAGPYVALKVGASTPFDDAIPTADAGFIAAAGYALALGTGALVFQARYDIGLVTVDDSYATKNRTFLFTLGYAFRQ